MNYNTKNSESTEFINGGLKVDYVSGCVFVDGEETHLTPIEFKLICLLHTKNVGKFLLINTY